MESKKGSWVRVKRGIYRDDLAKVEKLRYGTKLSDNQINSTN